MRLIEFDGLEFKLADEALLVTPIRHLFEKDKSKNKDYFWQQMSYLWFMYDPRSSYQYIIDETKRAEEVIAQEGLGKDWKPSDMLNDVIEIYKRQNTTTASLLLDDMRTGIEALRDMLRSFHGVKIDVKQEPRLASQVADTIADLTKKIPDLAKSLIEAEKALARDFDTEDMTRGNAQKSAFEDE